MHGRVQFLALSIALLAFFCAIPPVPPSSVSNLSSDRTLASETIAPQTQTTAPQTQTQAAAPQTQPATGQEEITVYARSQEKTKDRIFLIGDVEVRYKDLRLFADRVEIKPAQLGNTAGVIGAATLAMMV